MTIWQVASGDSRRSYSKLFTDFDVAAIGQGDIEESIERFKKAKRGDLVLLRRNNKTVGAVGKIMDEEPFEREDFKDVDGWTLRLLRRVQWFPDTGQTFQQSVLPRVTFTQVHTPALMQWLATLTLPDEDRELQPLPDEPNKISLQELCVNLELHGMDSDVVRRFKHRALAVTSLSRWYQGEGIRPSEHETTAFLVLPLLFSLGWTKKLVAVERKRVDIALFAQQSRADDQLVGLVEVKKQGASLRLALDQGAGYATIYPNCKLLITTDGIRYTCHVRQRNAFRIMGYVNLAHILEAHGLMDNRTSKDGVRLLAFNKEMAL